MDGHHTYNFTLINIQRLDSFREKEGDSFQPPAPPSPLPAIESHPDPPEERRRWVSFLICLVVMVVSLAISVYALTIMLTHLVPAAQDIRQILELVRNTTVISDDDRALLLDDANQIVGGLQTIAIYAISLLSTAIGALGTARTVPTRRTPHSN